MTLDDFLNQQRTETLQRFEIFWTEAHRCSTSKFTLLAKLRRAMLDPENIKARYRTVPAPERRMLELLLHHANGAISLDEIASGDVEDAQEATLHEILQSLADKGFIDFRSDSESARSVPRVTIAEELAATLRQTLQGDFRHPEQILSLRSFAESFTAQELISRLQSLPQPKSPEPDNPLETLLHPEWVRLRWESLQDEALKSWAEKAVQQFGGILPLYEIERAQGPLSQETRKKWKEGLERHFLGTIAFLGLDHFGFNVRDDYLVIFLEVAALRTEQQTTALVPQKHKLRSSGYAALLDFHHVLTRIQREDLRLTRLGSLRKYGADETLNSLLLVRGMKPEDAQAHLEWLVRLAVDIRLVQQSEDGTLSPTSQAIEWCRRSVEEQLREFLGPLLKPGNGKDSDTHAVNLRRQLGRLCERLQPGQWYPAGAVSRLAISQYLLDIVRGNLDSGRITLAAIQSAPINLKRLEEELLEWLQGRPNQFGLIDVALSGGDVDAIRTTSVATRYFGVPSAPETSPPLIVNPDFEIVLFPETSPEVHLLVHRASTLRKVDQVFHYHVDESSVTVAACLGLSGPEIVRTLARCCQGSLPQHIAYSIENWAGRVYNVTIEQVYILDLKSPETLQFVRRMPEIHPLVLREISPTVLAIREPVTDRAAVKALQKLGIYIRRSG